jgi:hypothetical protein
VTTKCVLYCCHRVSTKCMLYWFKFLLTFLSLSLIKLIPFYWIWKWFWDKYVWALKANSGIRGNVAIFFWIGRNLS